MKTMNTTELFAKYNVKRCTGKHKPVLGGSYRWWFYDRVSRDLDTTGEGVIPLSRAALHAAGIDAGGLSDYDVADLFYSIYLSVPSGTRKKVSHVLRVLANKASDGVDPNAIGKAADQDALHRFLS